MERTSWTTGDYKRQLGHVSNDVNNEILVE